MENRIKMKRNRVSYARRISKTSVGKRVVLSWVVVAIIFFVIGFVIGILV